MVGKTMKSDNIFVAVIAIAIIFYCVYDLWRRRSGETDHIIGILFNVGLIVGSTLVLQRVLMNAGG